MTAEAPKRLRLVDLTGFELQEAKKELGGRSLSEALGADDEQALYLLMFFAERRAGSGAKLGAVMRRPFAEILEWSFGDLEDAPKIADPVNPTNAGSTEPSRASVTSGE